MGKKNKKAKSNAVDTETVMARHVRRETLEIVNILLEKCSCQFGGQGQMEWADFMEVYELVEKLRKKQQNFVIQRSPREKHFTEFMQWLRENRVKTDAVEIENFPVGGYGVKATADIQEGALFLAIPRTIMMTTESAKASALGGLMEDDRILQAMPNIVLALHVLCEYCTPTSLWQPYLKILPNEYSTPLYFTPEELQHLKGSPTLSEMLNQFRNITRQYAYFFKLFQGHDQANKLPANLKNFCFDDYRWAVSSVMTRQNQIPNLDGQRMISALIPLWDMCNHTNGQITTDFSLENDRSECYTLKQISAGDQVFIFYGSRSNAELLIHNGFVYPKNQCDRLTIKLGVSKNDPLFSMKAEVLSRLSMLTSRLFSLHCGANPVDSDTLAYLRVFSMSKEELEKTLGSRDEVSKLRDFGEMVSGENEEKSWAFLATRTYLLLRSYPTNVDEDAKILEEDNTLSSHCRMAVQLRLCEKRILQTTQEYANRQKDLVKERVAQAEKAAKQMAVKSENKEGDGIPAITEVPHGDTDGAAVNGLVIEELADETATCNGTPEATNAVTPQEACNGPQSPDSSDQSLKQEIPGAAAENGIADSSKVTAEPGNSGDGSGSAEEGTAERAATCNSLEASKDISKPPALSEKLNAPPAPADQNVDDLEKEVQNIQLSI